MKAGGSSRTKKISLRVLSGPVILQGAAQLEKHGHGTGVVVGAGCAEYGVIMGPDNDCFFPPRASLEGDDDVVVPISLVIVSLKFERDILLFEKRPDVLLGLKDLSIFPEASRPDDNTQGMHVIVKGLLARGGDEARLGVDDRGGHLDFHDGIKQRRGHSEHNDDQGIEHLSSHGLTFTLFSASPLSHRHLAISRPDGTYARRATLLIPICSRNENYPFPAPP